MPSIAAQAARGAGRRGSNAREAHPIFFHHVLKGIRNGARMYAVDPRRTTSAQWADAWLGIHVGSDISLANAIAREIIHAGLANEAFIGNGTTGYEAYAASVEPYTLDRAERDTGVPAGLIRQLAHDYARADRAQICWTLGITEHHNAADNVFALINLALLTGHVGRYGSGLVPLRGQNNVQGGGDMGAIPNKLTGFQDIETNLAARARFEAVYGAPIPPKKGWHLSQMFEAMEDGELTACYIIGENPLRSEADTGRARKLLGGLEHFVVQDIFLTDTAKLAHVVLPATATWCEAEGTVTNSERRVQRVRKAIEPPAGARDDIEIICEIARRLGADWGQYTTPLRRPETLNLSPEDASRLGFAEGETVRVSSRRGSIEAPVHVDEILRAGLAFMTLHFPEQVETNILTLDTWDPKSGTAEFKATAIRVDKLDVIAPDGGQSQRAKAGG